MSTYTLSYRAKLTNASAVDFVTLWAAIPTPADFEAIIGVTVSSDTTHATDATTVQRDIEYTRNVGSPFSAADLVAVLTNVYTVIFSRGLSTPIVPLPVVFGP